MWFVDETYTVSYVRLVAASCRHWVADCGAPRQVQRSGHDLFSVGESGLCLKSIFTLSVKSNFVNFVRQISHSMYAVPFGSRVS